MARSGSAVADGDIDSQLKKAALLAAEATVDRLRRRPVVFPEWLSLQQASAYLSISEQALSLYVRQGVAPKSTKFSNNARRFKRSDLDAWASAGGPSQFRSAEGHADA